MNPGYTTPPGSSARQMDYLEDWLITLVQQAKRTNELLERQGKPGTGADAREESRIEKLGKRIETALGSQLSYRLNQAQGLANRGFSGTVEQARMDYAMEQLGRQFAAVMKPVMDALTYGAVQIEMRMRRMSGSDQNALFGMGVGAFAGRMVGGVPGMLLGGLMGSALMGRGGDSSSGLMGAVAAGYAGFKLSGGNPFATAGAALAGGLSATGDYGRYRERGANKFMAATAATVAFVSDLWDSDHNDEMRKAHDRRYRGTDAAPRRDVTPFQSEMMDAGGTYFEIQKAMIRATAGEGFEEGGPLKPIIDGMLVIIEYLAKIAGVDLTPASATVARGAEAMSGALAGAMR